MRFCDEKVVGVFVLVVAACGGGETTDTADSGSAVTPTTVAAREAAEETQPPTTEVSSEEPAASSTPGGIVLTIGDQSWEFSGAFCAYLNAPAGEEGSEWNVSMKQGDLQVYVTEDSFGTFVSITDVVNFGAFEWVAENDAVTLNVAGNDVTGEGTFTDMAEGNSPTEGTLTATCADWVQG